MSWKSVYGVVAGAVLAIGVISGAAQAAAEQSGEVPTPVEAESAFGVSLAGVRFELRAPGGARRAVRVEGECPGRW
ncbi:hypothetical protein [Nocardia sp. CA-120079]|uniref:hypothetical protein n=1 Tax=Nocardia sp. CA-120079 TaxID=3239974 RepID=UPI003D98508E